MAKDKRSQQGKYRSVYSTVTLLLCLCFVPLVHAQNTIFIYAPAGDSLAKRTAQDVQALLLERQVTSRIFDEFTEVTSTPIDDNKILAIGNRACDEVVSSTLQASVLCGLINHYFQPGDIGRNNIDYLPLEVPAKTFFELAKLIVPNAKTVGVLLGPTSHHRERFYASLARTSGMSAEFSLLNLQSNPVNALDPAMRKSQVFMALPDESTFNRAVAPWVLQLSLRYRMPLLGYSFNYANAGAIASLFQTRENLATNLVNRLFDESSRLEFSIRLNYAVASNLGIELLSEEEYLEALQGIRP